MINWLIQYSRAVLLVLVATNATLAIVLAGLSATESTALSESSTALSESSTALNERSIPQEHQTDTALAPEHQTPERIALKEPANAEVAKISIATPVSDVANQSKVCRVWGPEREAEQFGELRNALESAGGFPEIVENQIVGRADYLVYVDAYESATVARRIAGELQALDIETYRINRESGVILSVGVFSRQELAAAQVERLEKLGYTTLIEELSRAQTVYNLRAFVAVSSLLVEESTSACPQSEIGQS